MEKDSRRWREGEEGAEKERKVGRRKAGSGEGEESGEKECRVGRSKTRRRQIKKYCVYLNQVPTALADYSLITANYGSLMKIIINRALLSGLIDKQDNIINYVKTVTSGHRYENFIVRDVALMSTVTMRNSAENKTVSLLVPLYFPFLISL